MRRAWAVQAVQRSGAMGQNRWCGGDRRRGASERGCDGELEGAQRRYEGEAEATVYEDGSGLTAAARVGA